MTRRAQLHLSKTINPEEKTLGIFLLTSGMVARRIKQTMFPFLVWAFLLSSCEPMPAFAQQIYASYYTVKSCLKESGQYTMANGRRLDDKEYTVASWDYKFGTKLRITNKNNRRNCIVTVTDRGPTKKLYRQGRVADLSLASFRAIADCKSGVIPIEIEVVR